MRLFLGELVLAHIAQGAFKILGNLFPGGAGGNSAFGIAFSLIIDPTADIAYIFHRSYLRVFVWMVLV
jgi:hypothetical protein